jgi:hypothetical protein
MENVSSQFYIDGMAGNPQIFKIAAGDVITGFGFVVRRMIDGHAGNNAIGGQHVRNIQSLDDRPGMGCVHVVTVVETATDFGVGIFKRDKAVNAVSGGPVGSVPSVAGKDDGGLRREAMFFGSFEFGRN